LRGSIDIKHPAGKHAGIDDAFEPVEHRETGVGVHEKYPVLLGEFKVRAGAFLTL
jgi:hypothetical protein